MKDIMTEDYKQGYADGVSEIRNKLTSEVHNILQEEEKTYIDGGEQDDIIKGWIECLQMISHTLKGEL